MSFDEPPYDPYGDEDEEERRRRRRRERTSPEGSYVGQLLDPYAEALGRRPLPREDEDGGEERPAEEAQQRRPRDELGRLDRSRPRRRAGSDLGGRVLFALPAIFFAIFIVYYGGEVFAVGLFLVGILALHELFQLMRRVRPVDLAAFVVLLGMLFGALYGGPPAIVIALVAAFPLTFLIAVIRPRREHVAWGLAVTFFGILWIAVPLAHAVMLRQLPNGGGLVLDVLIGTFLGDTCAYLGGRAWGRRPLAPLISPNKTLEGLLAGIAGGTAAFWLFATGYQDWFDGTDALIIGFFVALAAPMGDLFQSFVKRDLEVKDSGRFFGPHGGVLDRIDAVLFSAVVGYYVAVIVM
jgi:phosphatidate cytidylyltransferase